jgi:hypothetical protein
MDNAFAPQLALAFRASGAAAEVPAPKINESMQLFIHESLHESMNQCNSSCFNPVLRDRMHAYEPCSAQQSPTREFWINGKDVSIQSVVFILDANALRATA